MVPTRDKREGWLAELKVGDNVGMRTLDRDIIVAVTRITPSGRIVVSGDRTFRPDGYVLGRAAWGYSLRLIPITAELRAEVEQRSLAASIHQLDLRHVSLDKLRRIWTILDE